MNKEELRQEFQDIVDKGKIVPYIGAYEEWLESKLLKPISNEDIKKKAKRWDELDEEISKMYDDENASYENDADLSDIGEVAARAFGWL